LQNSTSIEKAIFQSACEDCIKINEVKTLNQTFSRHLGLGEQEALSLAIQRQANLLIIDDRKAFRTKINRRFHKSYFKNRSRK